MLEYLRQTRKGKWGTQEGEREEDKYTRQAGCSLREGGDWHCRKAGRVQLKGERRVAQSRSWQGEQWCCPRTAAK